MQDFLPLAGFEEPRFERLAARVVVDGLQDMLLDYAIPPHLSGVARGCRVLVPMRRQQTTGTVVALVEPDGEWAARLKPLVALVDDKPVISEPLMRLAEWAARYYAVPLEQMVRCLVPGSVRQEKHEHKTQKVLVLQNWPEDEQLNAINKRAPRQAQILRYLHASEGQRATLAELGGSSLLAPARALEKKKWLRVEDEQVHRDPAAGECFAPSQPLPLNEEQGLVLDSILRSMERGDKQPIVLQGITGSGKTEVYLQAAAHALTQGKGVLILVPEISLTPQTMARFKSRFAGSEHGVAILHSAMSEGERFDEWHAIRQGRARVAIGPRSALFSPVQNLGLVIVDEEHDGSYKQENSPRYHGRDLAVLRASLEGACVVLGSATPSLESLHNVNLGKYRLLRMDRRADGQRLPLTRVLDMKGEVKDKRYLGILSDKLRLAIEDRIKKGEQVILLLNRRGFARSLQCPDCGYVVHCEHCAMPMTYHLTENRLICHMCGHRAVVPRACPECHSSAITLEGYGTQKVEAMLQRCFPQARVRRVDADVSSRKNALQNILADFRAHKIDILLGTQMISKGLDFPGVTLVGVLNADLGLSVPDPRAAERTFQLLTQVAGRAGRGELEGEVIIQTYVPHAPAIQFARRHDTDGFAENELAIREQLDFPPFTHMSLLTVRSPDEGLAQFTIETLHRRLLAKLPPDASMSEPMPAPLAKSHGQFRFQSTLRCRRARVIAEVCVPEIAQISQSEQLYVSLDVDAFSFM